MLVTRVATGAGAALRRALRAPLYCPPPAASWPARVAPAAARHGLHTTPPRWRGANPGSGGAPWNTTSVPPIAALLGAAGILPFLFFGAQHASMASPERPRFDAALGAAADRLGSLAGMPLRALQSGDQLTVRRRFLAYAACILSFMGGVQWGAALAVPAAGRPTQYAASVLPALAGWAALGMDEHGTAAHGLLTAAFTAVYLYDEALIGSRRLPPWYTFLRAPLTIAVVMTTTLAAWAGRDTGALH